MWYSEDAFVALVKPLDSFRGAASPHLHPLFGLRPERSGETVAQTEKRKHATRLFSKLVVSKGALMIVEPAEGTPPKRSWSKRRKKATATPAFDATSAGAR